MADGQDKRFYPRADTSFIVKYASEELAPKKATTANDVSGRGISFETDHLLAIGENLDIELDLAEMAKEIHAKGRVVRSWQENGKFLAAIEFTNIDYNDFIYVLDYSLNFVYHI